jgi:hypothetical protein
MVTVKEKNRDFSIGRNSNTNGATELLDQGACSFSTPLGAELAVPACPQKIKTLKKMSSQVNRLHLERTKLSRAARTKLKKARTEAKGTGSVRNWPAPISGDKSSLFSVKRPRSESITPPMRQAGPPQRQRTLLELRLMERT